MWKSGIELKLLILLLFIVIYFVGVHLYILSNGWDSALGKRMKQITQKKKEVQKAAKKAEEDKWISAHSPTAFLTIPEIKIPPFFYSGILSSKRLQQ